MGDGNKGFTLVELMVTLAVFAILVTIALPSFKSAIDKSKADTEVGDLIRGLSYARLEAIDRGISTRIRPSTANAAWTTELVVMSVIDDTAGRTNYYRVIPLMSSGAALNVTSGINRLDFNNLGGVSATVTFVYTLGAENRTVNVCLNGKIVLGSC
ncbi:GspH/FimT family pseudopilin [Pseudomonas gingeri]|uniref:Type II secretion system protein H n=1 Tax=Pseudomonas gingeri TaxID=117681 RepID=A0A7Y7YBJ6_9PSED|nr:GspH/FimT family pseudopilin [Pseudomonas gingeri]NWB25390.1 GspH/FimT family pseudopilin [Pseudomonas gingeri]NWC33431.1 GspH/FimT family pseudopilin [Pseudomonas gingeri]NWD52142.1 GspH/FimT family pseudopilin [Pseudomonas gingeri]